MNTAQLINFGVRNPRRNLPPDLARKRGESNFVSAFGKAYIASIAPHGFGGRQFALPGFGIADFIWVAWRHSGGDDATALSLERIQSTLAGQKLSAFEMKLSDWRKGLSQAYRYTYFADRAIVVVPPPLAVTAGRALPLFKELGVGMWSFDQNSGKITRHFTPRPAIAKNQVIRSRAVALLSRKIYFGQRRKMRQSRL